MCCGSKRINVDGGVAVNVVDDDGVVDIDLVRGSEVNGLGVNGLMMPAAVVTVGAGGINVPGLISPRPVPITSLLLLPPPPTS